MSSSSPSSADSAAAGTEPNRFLFDTGSLAAQLSGPHLEPGMASVLASLIGRQLAETPLSPEQEAKVWMRSFGSV